MHTRSVRGLNCDSSACASVPEKVALHTWRERSWRVSASAMDDVDLFTELAKLAAATAAALVARKRSFAVHFTIQLSPLYRHATQ